MNKWLSSVIDRRCACGFRLLGDVEDNKESDEKD